ncbi:hypothetical protein F4802DRAFT_439230 [Xylaria palmicola]|nr:hypothetical protein F4802DRAFT_439230 [Xylaria palmicola]
MVLTAFDVLHGWVGSLWFGFFLASSSSSSSYHTKVSSMSNTERLVPRSRVSRGMLPDGGQLCGDNVGPAYVIYTVQ